MKEGSPSHTALRVAMRRALHQLVDRPVVFEDDLALRILDEATVERVRQEAAVADRSPVSTHLRAFLAARSRIAEEAVDAAVEREVHQYVILGAGLDTWSARHPDTTMRVFEVDHAETQAWKRGLLADAGLEMPSGLTFVPVDFTTSRLEEALLAAGFDPQEPAAFSWLGVTPYLTEEDIGSTLSFVSSLVPGSTLVFDYAVSPRLLGLIGRMVYRRFAERVAAAGEPWLSSFEPLEMDARMARLGFGSRSDLGETEINRRYFSGRTDGLKVGSLARVMVARVGPAQASPTRLT